jgi:hypothetical protein
MVYSTDNQHIIYEAHIIALYEIYLKFSFRYVWIFNEIEAWIIISNSAIISGETNFVNSRLASDTNTQCAGYGCKKQANSFGEKNYVCSTHWSMSSLCNHYCTNSLFYTLNIFCESSFMRRSGHFSRQIGPNHNAQFRFTVALYRKPLCIVTHKKFNSNKGLYSWSMQIKLNILSRSMCDYRRGWDWWPDLLTTYTS